AERAQQPGPLASERHDIGICSSLRTDSLDAITRHLDGFDVHSRLEDHALLPAKARELERERVRVARLVFRGVDPADHAGVRKRRLERKAFLAGLHFAPDAKRLHRPRMMLQRLEVALF